MSMDLGTLTAYLALDGSAWEKGFDKAKESITGWGDKAPKWIKGATPGIVAAGLAAAVALGAAISQGIEQAIQLDSARAKIAAELGLTEAEAERVGGVVGKVYAAGFGESIDEVSAAVGQVVSSIDGMRDASAEALGDMTQKALAFAKTFEIDTARSTQVVGQLLKSGLVDDADEAFDLLTATMQKVPANVREDIMDAADEYGPFFASVGLDGQQAFNLLAEGADKGMYGIDKAGDALKEFTIRATDLNDTGAQTALESLGLSGTQMANDLLAGGDTARGAMEQITSALLGVEDPATQAALATALFGTPLEDLGKDAIPGFLSSLSGANDLLGDTTGAAQGMADTLSGSVESSWNVVGRTWEGITGQLGNALLPILGAVGEFLAENPAVLQVVAVALGILAAAFIGVTIATWAMNTALLANPITWIIIGIVALIAAIVLLVMNWDQVVAWITEVWGGFIGWITDGLNAFVGWWNGLWGDFAAWISAIWQGFVSTVTGVWQGFVDWITAVITAYIAWWVGVWLGVSSFFSDLWNGIVGFVTTAWDNVMSFLNGIPQAIMDVFAGAGEWLYSIGEDILNGLWDGLLSIWDGLVGWIGDIGQGIADTFSGVLDIHSPSRLFRRFGIDTMRGYIDGVARMQPSVEKAMKQAAPTPEMVTVGSGAARDGRQAAVPAVRVVNYYAAENQSLSAEEALFDALGSPRVKEAA